MGVGPLMQFGLVEASGFVVVSEYLADGYPESAVVVDRSGEKGDGAGGGLDALHLASCEYLGFVEQS